MKGLIIITYAVSSKNVVLMIPTHTWMYMYIASRPTACIAKFQITLILSLIMKFKEWISTLVENWYDQRFYQLQ